MSIRLIWNQVNPDEWQAGGIGSFYRIKRVDGFFVAEQLTGDEPIKRTIASQALLLSSAQASCQADLDNRA